MNLSTKWAGFLTGNGIEAAHWSFIGSPDAPDTEIMAYAKEYEFTVMTNDLDFGYILAITRGKKPSVIQMRTGALGHDRIGAVVLSAIKLLTAGCHAGVSVTDEVRSKEFLQSLLIAL